MAAGTNQPIHATRSRVLLHHLDKQRRLPLCIGLSLQADTMELLAMFCISNSVDLVAVGLTRLCQQNKWCRIGRLQAEGKIEENEWVNIE